MHIDVELSILAGGKSTRMGVHKGSLSLGEKNFVDHIIDNIGHLFSSINVIDNGLQQTKIPGVSYHGDALKIASRSSLLGIHSALYHSRASQTFILACDTPLVNPKVVEYIISQKDKGDIVVCVADGRFQPLYGIYHKKVLARVEETLLQDLHKIKMLLDEFDTYYIPEQELMEFDPEMNFIKNFNTYSDYQRLLQKGVNVLANDLQDLYDF